MVAVAGMLSPMTRLPATKPVVSPPVKTADPGAMVNVLSIEFFVSVKSLLPPTPVANGKLTPKLGPKNAATMNEMEPYCQWTPVEDPKPKLTKFKSKSQFPRVAVNAA